MRRDPGSRLFAQLAEEERKAGDLKEAIRVARAGLAAHPAYPAALLTLGRALIESGDAEGARMALQEAVKQAPDNILASRFLGQALEALGDLEGAVGRYRSTLAMAPEDRQLEARVESLQSRLEEARGRRSQLQPEGTSGLAAEEDGGSGPPADTSKPEAGESAAGEGGPARVGEGPPFSSATLAELYQRQGFTERAVEVYRQVLAERPGEERARARLAELVSLLAARTLEGPGEEQERRRRGLQRTIAGLEVLLDIARRR